MKIIVIAQEGGGDGRPPTKIHPDTGCEDTIFFLLMSCSVHLKSL